MGGRVATALKVSTALVVVAAITGSASYVFWGVFERDVPMTIGNMRGTALTVVVLAIPLTVLAMLRARAGSPRAVFVWLGSLGYLAYNGVMFAFGPGFNAFFLPIVAFLSLSFWALVTLVRALDVEALADSAREVPRRSIAVYLLACAVLWGGLWLQSIVPATLSNTMPETLTELGFRQNPVWVLDFAFTFPLAILGSLWILRRRPWGYVLSGTMVIMLTLETAGVAVDQVYGRLHDPAAPLDAVPILIGFTLIGAVFSILFLRRVDSADTAWAR